MTFGTLAITIAARPILIGPAQIDGCYSAVRRAPRHNQASSHLMVGDDAHASTQDQVCTRHRQSMNVEQRLDHAKNSACELHAS